MMENAITIFFFIMLLSLVMIFGYSFYGKYLENKTFELRLQESSRVAELVGSMPELACSQAGNFEKDCIDVHKITLLNNDYFFDYFGYSTITLHKIYPEGDPIILYDNPLDDYNDAYSTVFPVQIYDAVDNLDNGGTDYFGYVQVRMYYD